MNLLVTNLVAYANTGKISRIKETRNLKDTNSKTAKDGEIFPPCPVLVKQIFCRKNLEKNNQSSFFSLQFSERCYSCEQSIIQPYWSWTSYLLA
jgi:hypothetical protein